MISVTFVILIVSVLIIISRTPFRSVGIFYPPIFFSLLVIMGFGVPFVILNRFEEYEFFSIFWHYDYFDDNTYNSALKASLLVANIGLWAFYLGFKLGERLPVLDSDCSVQLDAIWEKRFFRLLVILSALPIAGMIINFLQAGGVAEYFKGNESRVALMEGKNIYALIQLCVPSAYLLWFFLKKGNVPKVQNSLFLATSIIFTISSNSKATLFVLLMSIFVVRDRFVKRISILKSIAIASAGFFLFILWELIFREYLVGGELTSVDASQNFLDASIFKLTDFILGNFMQLQTVSIIVDYYPKSGYLNGSSILLMLLIFVPRAIWASKPLTAAGTLTQTLWPARLETGTTLPPGLFGELFMNFSWTGVFLGMVVFGLFYGYLWNNFHNKPGNIFRNFLLCVFTSLLLHFFRGELSSPFLLGVFFTAPAFVLYRLVLKPARRNSR